MIIRLDSVSKQYYKHTILDNVTTDFHTNRIYGIKGQNGSGKSTLLKLISSVLTPSEGQIDYKIDKKSISHEKARHKIALYSPTTQFLPNQTLEEILQFHFQFQSIIANHSIDDVLRTAFLEDARELNYQELSSGMQQRLKLAIAFFSAVDFLLLDEPTSNLDQGGIEYFYQLIRQLQLNRGLIIASNEERDFLFCEKIIDIQEFKPEYK